jgi:CYTH domain-containing protein
MVDNFNLFKGHYNFHIIDNKATFKDKVDRVISKVSMLTGLQKPKNFKKKFLLNEDFYKSSIPKEIKYETINIEQFYLKSTQDSNIKKIRKRGQNGNYTYSFQRRILSENQVMDSFKRISAQNYLLLSQESYLPKIEKKLFTFIYEESYFEISKIYLNNENVKILSLEVDDEKNIVIPFFLKKFVLKEITNDINFETINLIKNSYNIK